MSCQVERCRFRNNLGCKLIASTKKHASPPEGFKPPTKEQLLHQIRNTPGVETCEKNEALGSWIETIYKFYSRDARIDDAQIEDGQGTVNFDNQS